MTRQRGRGKDPTPSDGTRVTYDNGLFCKGDIPHPNIFSQTLSFVDIGYTAHLQDAVGCGEAQADCFLLNLRVLALFTQ